MSQIPEIIESFHGFNIHIDDLDGLRLVRIEVNGGDREDAIDVDFEGNFDLRDHSFCLSNAGEFERGKQGIILGMVALPLIDGDDDALLIIAASGEDF